MSVEENKALVRDFIFTANRERRTPSEMCAPGVTFHIGGTPAMNLEEFEHFQRTYYAAFTDPGSTIEEMVAEGESVAFRQMARATHTAEFMGIPASGTRIVVPTIGIAHIDHGRIAEWWNSPDRLSWMQQIGAFRV